MRGTRWTLEIASPTLQLSNFTNGLQSSTSVSNLSHTESFVSVGVSGMWKEVHKSEPTPQQDASQGKYMHEPYTIFYMDHVLDVSHFSLFRSNLWCATSAGRTSTSKANWSATKKMSTPSRSPKNRNSIYIRLCSKHHSRPPEILWSMLEFICCFPLTSEIYKVYPTLKAQFPPTGAQSLQSLCKLVAEDQKARL